MSFSSGSSSSISSEINVTPLIDVLLVLLIIFMVIVPVLPRGLDSSVPQDKPSTPITQSSPTIVHVLAASSAGAPPHYRVNERELELAALRPALQQVFASRRDHSLFVQGDRTLNYGQIATAIGEARAAGAGAVGLMGGQAR